jgi:diguanylate cyclase (GGDEF)-like protein
MGTTAAELNTQASGPLLAWGLLLSLVLLTGALVYLGILTRSRRGLRSRLRAANSELSDLRGRDRLTGLIARSELELLLESEVAQTDRSGSPLALLYVGLDGVRAVNEAYGLRVGDGLLVEAAKRLSTFVADPPRVARAGGDEFALLLRADAQQAVLASAALHEALIQPFLVEAQTLQVGASIGIACYPQHGSRPLLLSHAALAMRSVKLDGGGQALYDPAMGVNLREQTELLRDLRQALAQGELHLYYQPKVDALTLQVTAAEALLRWKHPRRGMISPAVFVPLAEKHGLIGEIGAWVIEEACRQAARWRLSGLRMRIAVNISGLQLRQEGLVDRIEACLRRHHVPAARLTCEITETVAMEDTAITREAFERLRRAGLHVSIDDFGTGYSSLATLRRLPAAELKIDRAFVTDLGDGGEDAENARSIVRAIIQMAHSLHLRVVAEGVESEGQRDQLIGLGCDELQGYLFAKPMTAASLALWADGEREVAASMFRPSLFDPTAPAPLGPPAA